MVLWDLPNTNTMSLITQPEFPIYIPSKSRAKSAFTPRYLDIINVPYRIVVEEQQYEEYNKYFPDEKLLTLDPAYKETFDMGGDFPEGTSTGSGPARNFIWDHSVAEGQKYHWIMDDNIINFGRLHKNQRLLVGDGFAFRAMEDFTQRYKNVAMSGPNYFMFLPSRNARPPFITNTRIYSCNLIRNDIPFRWRGRYNEDTDLSLRILKAGWVTIQFNAFYQYKMPTQKMTGGNTEAFYGDEGTLPKSKMIVDMHPDVAKLSYKFSRWHHTVDYSVFKQGLVKDKNYVAQDLSQVQLTREAVKESVWKRLDK